jgi:hypothetical protein
MFCLKSFSKIMRMVLCALIPINFNWYKMELWCNKLPLMSISF